MRVTAILMAAVIFAAPTFAEKEASGPVFEPNTYRYGGTYTVVKSQSASAVFCHMRQGFSLQGLELCRPARRKRDTKCL